MRVRLATACSGFPISSTAPGGNTMPMPDLRRRRRADRKVNERHARRYPQAGAASLFALALVAGSYALPAFAQTQPKPGDVTGDASLTGLAVLNTDIDNGGSFRWDGFTA